MSKTNPRVDDFIARVSQWEDETRALRAIMLDCGLEEDLKWGKPCYAFDGGNLAIIQGFKEHCSLMFFKGVLLDDTHGVLVSPGENSQAAMRIQFTSARQISDLEAAVRAYVTQAIAVEASGLKVERTAATVLDLPSELTARLDQEPALAAAFDALTPGRRRAHAMHISAAKQSSTRVARVERAVPKILAGKGPNERPSA